MTQIRTRFAPSPTGYMHIGNLRTALYAYLIAKSQDGKFILRIEDTDLDRFVEGATEVIYNTLKQTGLNWDEGPLVGGEFGPYIQSERKNNYIDYAMQLVDKGLAYFCFCSKERLEKLKDDAKANGQVAKYDGHCKSLTKEEIKEKLDSNTPFVIRQKMPTEGISEYTDAVYGKVTIENKELEDQILIKTDKMPTYNFANVIDDHLMKITHVVRGNEYLVSTPKYNLLYNAFEWEPPTYIHLPLIMKSKTEKLSKRNGSASFQDLLEEGYLQEAIINYIALLGWSPKNSNEEFFDLEALRANFSIAGINKSPSIFDKEKLTWMNAQYLQKMSDQAFIEVTKPYIEKVTKDYDVSMIANTLKKRITVLNEIEDMIGFYKEIKPYDISIYRHKKMKTNEENSYEFLEKTYAGLSELEIFDNDHIYESLVATAKANGLKNGQVIWPLRTALTGVPVSPGGATEVAQILGKEETLKRIKYGMELLKA